VIWGNNSSNATIYEPVNTMQEHNGTLYSIGHGARRLEDFISLLKTYGISFVLDVRSKPRSRFHPQYNQHALEESLKLSGIRYVFMGDNLGGLPKDESCYDPEGHVVYSEVKTRNFFREGVSRLLTAHEKKFRAACMCSEIDACDCHRSKLIGDVLLSYSISMLHINRTGSLENQEAVMQRIINKDGGDLFSLDQPLLRSRKSYK
jgi:uncharacterized protein (DUF488 family)